MYLIEKLTKTHILSQFDCKTVELNHYLTKQAHQDMKRNISTCYIIALESEPHLVIGYYTLSSSGTELNKLPESYAKKLPRYPFVPALCLGRLAIDHHFQRKGLGAIC